MKTFLRTENGDFAVTTPFKEADHAVAEIACPKCSHAPLRVSGSGMHIADNDREYRANGYCRNCKALVGTLVAQPSTLFGLREDHAVLNGRARVY